MRQLILAIAFLLVACTTAARALVVVPVDLGQLTRDSLAIVHGTVIDVRPERALDRRRIDTLVSLSVSSYLKGNLGQGLTFRVPGGEFGRYRTIVPGAPTFRIGDDVILFLGAEGPTVPYVVGLSQGVFRVTRDAETGDSRVVPPVLTTDEQQPQRVTRGDIGRRPVPLNEFMTTIRALAGRIR